MSELSATPSSSATESFVSSTTTAETVTSFLASQSHNAQASIVPTLIQSTTILAVPASSTSTALSPLMIGLISIGGIAFIVAVGTIAARKKRREKQHLDSNRNDIEQGEIPNNRNSAGTVFTHSTSQRGLLPPNEDCDAVSSNIGMASPPQQYPFLGQDSLDSSVVEVVRESIDSVASTSSSGSYSGETRESYSTESSGFNINKNPKVVWPFGHHDGSDSMTNKSGVKRTGTEKSFIFMGEGTLAREKTVERNIGGFDRESAFGMKEERKSEFLSRRSEGVEVGVTTLKKVAVSSAPMRIRSVKAEVSD
ncbi:UNVERIFIED_CONTAM: hypothetical protein HDU68_007499 [Siphonaria sp. JEL0065]|nr:hypothetical protein HDU68_007499 [Siphonaria sp. JEL0065]